MRLTSHSRMVVPALPLVPLDGADEGAAGRLPQVDVRVAVGLADIDSMLANDRREIDENHPRLVAVPDRLRDRLKALLAWARSICRMG